MILRSKFSRVRVCHDLCGAFQSQNRWVSSPVEARRKPRERLRILFCGGDVFGIPSLRALHEAGKSGESNIASIDVVTKKNRRVGRGRANLYTPPLTAVAAELGLPCHRIDTFTGWSPPGYGSASNPYINLVIAVSFGLMIPLRILKQCTYGGLNLHPSMLPALRGAAPIQWTIINGLTHTGLSVQTLHPTEFDAGVVVAQTPSPGIAIPNHKSCSHWELRDYLAPVGAEMLVKALRDRLYEPPYIDVSRQSGSLPSISFAPKIKSSMKQIDFDVSDAREILRRNRATGSLWAMAEASEGSKGSVRIIFSSNMRLATTMDLEAQTSEATRQFPPGRPFAICTGRENIFESSAPLYINTIDGSTLCVPSALVEGSTFQPAAAAAARGHLFTKPSMIGDYHVYPFHSPLQRVVPDPH